MPKNLVVNFGQNQVFKEKFGYFRVRRPFSVICKGKNFFIAYLKISDNFLSKNGITFNHRKIC